MFGMNVSSETRRAATLAGFTKESFGQWMNLARLAERRGDLSRAAYCARRALAVREQFPHLVCEGKPMPPTLLEAVNRLASLG